MCSALPRSHHTNAIYNIVIEFHSPRHRRHTHIDLQKIILLRAATSTEWNNTIYLVSEWMLHHRIEESYDVELGCVIRTCMLTDEKQTKKRTKKIQNKLTIPSKKRKTRRFVCYCHFKVMSLLYWVFALLFNWSLRSATYD